MIIFFERYYYENKGNNQVALQNYDVTCIDHEHDHDHHQVKPNPCTLWAPYIYINIYHLQHAFWVCLSFLLALFFFLLLLLFFIKKRDLWLCCVHACWIQSEIYVKFLRKWLLQSEFLVSWLIFFIIYFIISLSVWQYYNFIDLKMLMITYICVGAGDPLKKKIFFYLVLIRLCLY